MNTWIVMLSSYLIIPIVMMITGILYLKRPEKTINWMHGYRSERAMANQETWDFAQKYFGNVCWHLGIGLTIFVFLFMVSALGQCEEMLQTIGMIIGAVEVFAMIYGLVPTEMALKKKASTQKAKKLNLKFVWSLCLHSAFKFVKIVKHVNMFLFTDR